MNVIERFHTQSIARDEQLLSPLVPDSKGKHPSQIVNTISAVLLIEMEDCFSVAMCLIDVTPGLELRAKISVVVDFAVEYDVQRAILIGHGLMAGRHVDNTQTAVAQPDCTVQENPFVVGATVGDHVAHPSQDGSVHSPS